jgi:CheY-like chemotaxis protein
MTASLRFLIADDNKDAAQTLAALLTHERHEVRLAHDGRKAVDLALSWEPDVVVLDLQMPEMSGFVAAEMIRRNTQVSVLAALTGLSGQTVREQAEKAGFDLFFSKGVGFGELSDALIALATERRHGR